jgi:phage terminase Nu1 subunit (DNA packaging protein)
MFFMQETFFTSKEAAQITGCTLRQIQYWREKGIVVPVIGDTEDAVFITPGLIWWNWLLWYIGCLRG